MWCLLVLVGAVVAAGGLLAWWTRIEDPVDHPTRREALEKLTGRKGGP